MHLNCCFTIQKGFVKRLFITWGGSNQIVNNWFSFESVKNHCYHLMLVICSCSKLFLLVWLLSDFITHERLPRCFLLLSNFLSRLMKILTLNSYPLPFEYNLPCRCVELKRSMWWAFCSFLVEATICGASASPKLW